MDSVFIGIMCAMLLGVFAGGAIAIGIVPGSLDECRRANSGYDCRLEWVRGEAFQ